MTNTNQTKELVLDFFHRLAAHDIAGAAALMAEDHVDHGSIAEAQGRAGFIATQGKVRLAFPDGQQTLEDLIVDGDKAVLRTTFSGTQTGPMTMVNADRPASNKAVKFEQIHIVRVANGQLVEHWLGQDSIRMFRQLGLQITPA